MDCTEFTQCSGCNQINLCKECVEVGNDSKQCGCCEQHFCVENCDLEYHCDSCDEWWCDGCADEGVYWTTCDTCAKTVCPECNATEDVDAIRICEDCSTYYCGECMISMCNEEETNENNCAGCIKTSRYLLLLKHEDVRKENMKIKTENEELKEQVAQVQTKNEELEKKVGQMQSQNNSLQEQLLLQMERFKELEEKIK